jgi:hypothetical protein
MDFGPHKIGSARFGGELSLRISANIPSWRTAQATAGRGRFFPAPRFFFSFSFTQSRPCHSGSPSSSARVHVEHSQATFIFCPAHKFSLSDDGAASLQVTHNHFTGTLEPLSGLTLLIALDASSNQITGSVPKWLGRLSSSMDQIRLDNTFLSCNLPSQLTIKQSGALHVLKVRGSRTLIQIALSHASVLLRFL